MGMNFYLACFNRVKGLISAINFVQRASLDLRLIVLDMNSSWKKFHDVLAEFKDVIQVERVTHLDNPRYLWREGFFLDKNPNGFFLSDGDILFDDLPSDAFEKMIEISNKYPYFPKVGLDLSTEGLPNSEYIKAMLSVAKSDKRYHLEKDILVCASDTTIAYYPVASPTFYFRPALRLSGRYKVTHYPWFEVESELDEEAQMYRMTASRSSSTALSHIKTASRHKLRVEIRNLISFLGVQVVKRISDKTQWKWKATQLYIRASSHRGVIAPSYNSKNSEK